MSEFPSIEPLAVRPEQLEPKQIWQPSWQCFCCQDTGKIQPYLVHRVMPAFNWQRDRIPLCQNCRLYRDWLHLEGTVDTRFEPNICKRLDEIAREDWRTTNSDSDQTSAIKEKIEQQVHQIACNFSLRSRPRTGEEQMIALQTHQLKLSDANCELSFGNEV